MKKLVEYITEVESNIIHHASKVANTTLYIMGEYFDDEVFGDMCAGVSDIKLSEFKHIFEVLTDTESGMYFNKGIFFNKDFVLFSHDGILSASLRNYEDLSDAENKYLQKLTEHVLSLGDWEDQYKWFLFEKIDNKTYKAWLLTEKRNLSGESQLGHRFSFVK